MAVTQRHHENESRKGSPAKCRIGMGERLTNARVEGGGDSSVVAPTLAQSSCLVRGGMADCIRQRARILRTSLIVPNRIGFLELHAEYAS
jgi:hypothetical protein